MNNKVFIVAVPAEIGVLPNKENKSSLLGYNVIFSGVGKINATMAAYRAFNEGYKEVINIGSCGSLNLPSGEIVKVTQVFQDIDATPLAPYGDTPFEMSSNQIILDKLSPLISCFTTDYFYDESQKSKYSKNYLDMINKCTILDMECFALAKVCKKLNLKFSSYKWISDDGDASSWEQNCKIGLEKVKELL
jgi:adenosylhomocysteine nucleosidase|tara:strand:+ start:9709 stop:10281 length:573 start_codon:yes stop_codon:yes gene_type:complete